MGSCRRALVVLAMAAAGAVLLATAPASAKPPGRIGVEVLVSHISQSQGPVDKRAERLHEKLRDQFRYNSLRVLEHRRLGLGLDEVGTVKLPNGRSLRVRPIHVGDRGVLMAVGVEGTLQTDMRIPNHHLVVIGAERFEDGKLVISLEPDF